MEMDRVLEVLVARKAALAGGDEAEIARSARETAQLRPGDIARLVRAGELSWAAQNKGRLAKIEAALWVLGEDLCWSPAWNRGCVRAKNLGRTWWTRASAHVEAYVTVIAVDGRARVALVEGLGRVASQPWGSWVDWAPPRAPWERRGTPESVLRHLLIEERHTAAAAALRLAALSGEWVRWDELPGGVVYHDGQQGGRFAVEVGHSSAAHLSAPGVLRRALAMREEV
jgi:hypothetical protein